MALFKECVVIGAGISGIAIGRWLKEYNIDFVVLEKTEDIAGLWRFREDYDYGVMDFTHINVSKYNYCFSDFPYPNDSVEFMHHKHIYTYAKAYAEEHKLFENIRFKHQVTLIEEYKEKDDEFWRLASDPFRNIRNTGKLWKVTVKDLVSNSEIVYITPNVSIATGHHGTPRYAEFPGQETFTGKIIHSVQFKSAKLNDMSGKRVLLVGIGNSSVDAADNLVTQGGCPKVTISARSGAWVFPNYLEGLPIDLHINRLILMLPWKIGSAIFENIIKFVFGDPKLVGLNPKLRALQAHPTISATLCHHLQRKRVNIQPDIRYIECNEVTFENGEKDTYDSIILCTGYKIDLNFLHEDLKRQVFADDKQNVLNLFKLVFQPDIGSSLSFIGYVQPHSGGILPMSEIQARWIVYLMKGLIKLPSREDMYKSIDKYREKFNKRFYKSNRHTLQEDPITYNDEIASFYGAKPNYFSSFSMFWRYLFSANGPAQWRLNGIDSMSNAQDIINSVPVPDTFKRLAIFLLFLAILIYILVLLKPYLLPFLIIPLILIKKLFKDG